MSRFSELDIARQNNADDEPERGKLPEALAPPIAPTGQSTADTAVEFLEKLRPGGPWVLTAIVPDGGTTTITAKDAEEIKAFIREHDGKRNLYYSVNPTRTALSKKAAKIDIAAIEYALADLDPADGETPEQAKARYLAQLNGEFEPKATALVDSGNGIQVLWRLKDRIVLGEPIKNEQGKFAFSQEDSAKIDDVEARVAAVMLRLGSKAGTQNIDRILRLPGTMNLPNKKKRKAGRTACPTSLYYFDGITHPIDAFPLPEKQAPETDGAGTSTDEGTTTLPPMVEALLHIEGNGPYPSRSELLFAFITAALRAQVGRAAIVDACLDQAHEGGGIYQHCKENGGRPYVERQIDRAQSSAQQGGFETDANGRRLKTQRNIRTAMELLGVKVSYDMFHDQMLISGLEGHDKIDDAAMVKLWLTIEQRFRFLPSKDFFFSVVEEAARRNSFHPVRNYLDSLTWDGTGRVDRWLITYGGAEDTPYVCAVGKIVLVAAVRRVRQPGCKFDEMLILESEQGTEKSLGLSILAVNSDWFSDDLPLNADGKKAIEQLRGRWIVEAAEMSGLKKADVEPLKAFLSRQVDRARLAYGRITTQHPRECIVVGTTNEAIYLKDITGNRRFWPVKTPKFNVEALRRDRDQLWAEAAAREKAGTSIRLDPSLWAAAAKEQNDRTAPDPWCELLGDVLGDLNGKILNADAWTIVRVDESRRTQEQNARLGKAMRALGFERKSLRFKGKKRHGYARGTPDEQEKRIVVIRDHDNPNNVWADYEEKVHPPSIFPSMYEKPDEEVPF